MARKKLVAANWKMNKTIAEAEAFARELKTGLEGISCDLAIFPPFLSLAPVARILEGTAVRVGAQDVFWEDHGAFTGEVSCAMLLDAGAGLVLVGHSERRHLMGESDEVVAKKLGAALDSGLVVVLCVGEKLEDRESGRARSVVERQLISAFEHIDASLMRRIVVAYEPVWAIGTGRTASADDAEEMHAFIRSFAKDKFGDSVARDLRIQYGGSVKPGNAAELLGRDEIDGALVGGASLEVDSFLAIARAVG
jgi:triosephosphate isomerase